MACEFCWGQDFPGCKNCKKVAIEEKEGPEIMLDIIDKCMYYISMHRVNYHLTNQQIATLKAESLSTGLSVAELIRRAIDSCHKGGNCENQEKDKKQENKEVKGELS